MKNPSTRDGPPGRPPLQNQRPAGRDVPPYLRFPSGPNTRQQGVALVITLLCLVLLVVLAVGFLSNVATSRTASATEHGIALTQSLSDSVVELVKAQITEGTKSQASNGTDLGWASQPGMIRTFQVGGTPGTYYKLYSATEMVADGSAYSVNDDVPANAGNQAVWADLNRPVMNADGTTLSYPIVNPDAVGKVEGFTCNASSPLGYDSSKAASPANNPAPMPVRWLYVLANGTMAPAVASGNSSATVAGATTSNPIIGRVAFWTDDDTCKVNLNTASEGTFWDIPRADTATERDFSSLQPVKNEFQRYPGHPAMTSLSSVFGSWLSPNGTSGNYTLLSKYYGLAPRINDTDSPDPGGTVAGTQAGTLALGASRTAIAPDTDRLYASTDEFLFSALGTVPSSPSSRTTNAANLTKDVIEKTRFFTTTDSRAPDVNLFGQPRITIWPMRPLPYNTSNTTGKWTPQDQLIDFCSTIGGNRYAFTRDNENSPTADFASGSRNEQILNYLKSVTSRPIPGFPNQSFENKYTADERDQILTEIFDYIRSTAPIYSYGVDSRNFSSPTSGTPFMFVVPITIGSGATTKKGFGCFKTINEVDILFYAYDDTSVPPKRFMQAVILPHLYFPHLGFTDYSQLRMKISGLAGMTVTKDGSGSPVSLGMADGLEANVVGRSWFQTAGTVGAAYGLTPILVDPVVKTLGSTSSSTQYPFFSDPIEIPIPTTVAGNTTWAYSNGTSSPGTFTFSQGNLVIDLYNNRVASGPSLQTLRINLSPDVTVDGAGSTIPIPIPYPQPPASYSAASAEGLVATSTFVDRYNLSSGPTPPASTYRSSNTARYYYPGDVVRGAVIDPSGPARGDVRMVAGLKDVPANYFAMIPSDGPVANIRTNLRSTRQELAKAGTNTLMANTSGNLVSGVSNYKTVPSTRGSCQPFVPPGLNGALLKTSGSDAPGDWTSSMGASSDSAGIDLPDFFSGKAATHFGDLQMATQGGAINFMNTDVFYSPNRTMPSAIMFGSLPTGVWRGNPWQTLLFCPNSAATISGATHPGSVNPPDHLLLDLFKMPVVEPYAISDPFSTAGKINLNYRLAPFNHITRKTGIYALLKSARLYAVPEADVNIYKYPGRYSLDAANTSIIRSPATPSSPNDYRLKIDPDQTSKAFDAKFDSGDIFRSASQLCEMFLYPVGTSYDASGANIKAFWSNKRLTGDNMRESPYRDLYGRVTTQSNTYTVHYIVQALKKAPTGAADVWTEGTDKVIGEYRGSTSVERYIDPEDTRLKTSPPDFATAPTSAPSAANRMDSYYRIRTLGIRRFNP